MYVNKKVTIKNECYTHHILCISTLEQNSLNISDKNANIDPVNRAAHIIKIVSMLPPNFSAVFLSACNPLYDRVPSSSAIFLILLFRNFISLSVSRARS